MFKVALAIFKLNEHNIGDLEDPVDVFRILQNMPRRLIDCHRLMEYVFNPSSISADLCPKDIQSKRSLFREQRKQRRVSATRNKHA
ncbi:hypothetical protein J3Q64DRAFT_1776224 [Phycomyces blakesleeanus]|uniref:Uncharacterized protein n=1 Tax=Phycomyces blakesleeanus TaxID=4837 RepID=A0ABR3AKD3_PHYBL